MSFEPTLATRGYTCSRVRVMFRRVGSTCRRVVMVPCDVGLRKPLKQNSYTRYTLLHVSTRVGSATQLHANTPLL